MKTNKTLTLLLVVAAVLAFSLTSCASANKTQNTEAVATETTATVQPAADQNTSVEASTEPAQPVLSETIETAKADVSKDVSAEVPAEATPVETTVPEETFEYSYIGISSNSEDGKETITISASFAQNAEPVSVTLDANVEDGTVVMIPDENAPIAKAVIHVFDDGNGRIIRNIDVFSMKDELISSSVMTSGPIMIPDFPEPPHHHHWF